MCYSDDPCNAPTWSRSCSETLQVPPWYDFVNKILEDWNCLLLAPCTWNSDLKIRSFRDTSNTSCRRYTLIGLRSGLNYSSTPMYWKVLLLFTSVDWENKILPIESSPFDIIAAAHLHTKDQIHPTTCNTLSMAIACFQCHFRAWGFQDYTFSSFVSSAYITGWSSWSHLCLVSDLNTWDKGHTTDPKV